MKRNDSLILIALPEYHFLSSGFDRRRAAAAAIKRLRSAAVWLEDEGCEAVEDEEDDKDRPVPVNETTGAGPRRTPAPAPSNSLTGDWSRRWFGSKQEKQTPIRANRLT